MFNPQMTSSQMELLPLVCLCLLSWSGTTSADPPVTVSVKQDDDVILPCSINANMETGVFDWTKDGQTEVFLYVAGSHYNNGRTGQDQQFKGRVSHFHDELKHGNASIKIRNAKMADSGNYTCKFPNNHPPPTFHVKLVVEGVLKDRTGAASEPSIKIVKTQDRVLLQCVVRGASPKPKVEWKDSSGSILPAEEPQVTERGGSYDIILQAPVTKTDHYRCVVTQEEIQHQIYAETYVPLNDNTGWIVAGVLGLLLVVVLVVLCMCEQKHKRELQRLNQIIEDLKKRLSASGSSDPPTEVTTLQSAAS